MFERKSNKRDAKREDAQDDKAREEKTGSPNQRAAGDSARPADTLPASAQRLTTTERGINAMIGAKVKVNGDIVSSEDLLVEGEVTGSITLTENELVIGTSGKVQANINAKTVRIEGEVREI